MARIFARSIFGFALVLGMAGAVRAAPPTVQPSPGYDLRLQQARHPAPPAPYVVKRPIHRKHHHHWRRRH